MLLAAVTVSVGQVIRAVDPQLVGVQELGDEPQHQPDRTDGSGRGFNLFRLPGGSDSDQFHFNAQRIQGGHHPEHGQLRRLGERSGLVTLDFGSGSPQEAAAVSPT